MMLFNLWPQALALGLISTVGALLVLSEEALETRVERFGRQVLEAVRLTIRD